MCVGTINLIRSFHFRPKIGELRLSVNLPGKISTFWLLPTETRDWFPAVIQLQSSRPDSEQQRPRQTDPAIRRIRAARILSLWKDSGQSDDCSQDTRGPGTRVAHDRPASLTAAFPVTPLLPHGIKCWSIKQAFVGSEITMEGEANSSWLTDKWPLTSLTRSFWWTMAHLQDPYCGVVNWLPTVISLKVRVKLDIRMPFKGILISNKTGSTRCTHAPDEVSNEIIFSTSDFFCASWLLLHVGMLGMTRYH